MARAELSQSQEAKVNDIRKSYVATNKSTSNMRGSKNESKEPSRERSNTFGGPTKPTRASKSFMSPTISSYN